MTQHKETDPFDMVGLEAVMATLALDYIKSHVVEREGRKIYEGDQHTMHWYQCYKQRQIEAYASKQTQIQKGV